jgi:uncharacterized membrane protein YkoI
MRNIIGLVIVLAAGVTLAASDKKIQMKDLPPAVRQAVEAETKGAALKGLALEKEEGKTYYAAETTVNGRSRDLRFDATGHLVEVEEQMAIDAAPAPVQAALKGRDVVRLESVTKDKAVTYEVQVRTKGKTSSMTLDANGKPVKN